jgi:S1-C subfamily serine protease
MRRSNALHQKGRQIFRFGAWVGVSLLGILIILLVSVAIGWTSRSWARSAPDGFADLAEKASPAVVNISTEWTAAASQAAGDQAQQEEASFEEFFRRSFGQGGVIEAVASRPVRSGRQAAARIETAIRKGDSVAVRLVSRDSEQRFIALPLATS